MAIMLQPEVRNWISQEAEREGVAPEEIMVRAIEAQWAIARRAPRLSRRESDLLNVVSEGLPQEFWDRYRPLRQKLEAETLTEQEREVFLQLNRQVEAKNVVRMEALLELAKIHKTTLPEIMQRLGVGPIEMPV